MKLADKAPLLIEHDVEVMRKVDPVAANAVRTQLALYQPEPEMWTVVPGTLMAGVVTVIGGEPLGTLRMADPWT